MLSIFAGPQAKARAVLGGEHQENVVGIAAYDGSKPASPLRRLAYRHEAKRALLTDHVAGVGDRHAAHEALEETRLLLSRLEGPTTLLSDHMSNFLDVHGRIPDDRDAMLAEIDAALRWPLERFRPPTEKLVGMNL